MKKTGYARAGFVVLAASAAPQVHAQAPTSVTLYGVVDAGIEYVNRVASGTGTAPIGSRFGMPSNGGLSASRWGLRGSEDLGGGWRAFFNLENGFGSDTGQLATANNIFSRAALVGLANHYGKLSLGRQVTSLTEAMVNFAPLRFSTLYEPGVWWLGINYRENNMVKYSGEFGGVQAVAHYSFGAGLSTAGVGTPVLYDSGNGEVPGHGKDNTAYGASLMWSGGAFAAGLGYDQWNPAPTPGNAGKVRKVGAAASYTTGPFKFTGGYRWNKADFSTGANLIRDDYWFAGVNYRVVPSVNLLLAYFYSDIKSQRVGTAAAPSTATSNAINPPNPQEVAFIVDYDFSKRTDLYLSIAWTHNGSLVNDGAFTGYKFGYPQAPGQKNMVGVTTGIRHVF